MQNTAAEDDGSNGSVTTIISHEILAGAEERYESWLKEAREVCMKFAGYLSTDVIRPVLGQRNYTVIIRFGSFDQLSAWIDSPERRTLMVQMTPFLPKGDKYETRTGLEFWFTPAESKASHPKPWKQWLITWSAIFPLTVIVPFVLSPVYISLPALTALLPSRALNAAVVVLMMVYVIMPRYTKLVSRWLFR